MTDSAAVAVSYCIHAHTRGLFICFFTQECSSSDKNIANGFILAVFEVFGSLTVSVPQKPLYRQKSRVWRWWGFWSEEKCFSDVVTWYIIICMDVYRFSHRKTFFWFSCPAWQNYSIFTHIRLKNLFTVLPSLLPIASHFSCGKPCQKFFSYFNHLYCKNWSKCILSPW